MADDGAWSESDEDLLMVTGRGGAGKGGAAAAAGKKRKASDSDDDFEQQQQQQQQKQASKGARGGGPAAKKRAAAAADSDDDDDHGGGGGGDADEMDDAERAKLAAMNELEREMYLFEREERLQRARERRQVLKQAQQAAEARTSSRRAREKTGADAAIDKLARITAAREREKQKQARQKKAAATGERARRRRRSQEEEDDDEEEEEEGDDDDEETEDEARGDADASEMAEEAAASDDDDDDDGGLLGTLAADEEEDGDGGRGGGPRVRAEAYDDGGGGGGEGYDELDEAAGLEEVRAVQLRRADLEAWHNEPFFEEDLRGAVLRVVPNYGSAPRPEGAPRYILARVVDVVQRNSYPFGKPGARTRKWLHLDDMGGGAVFRHQMTLVSNGELTEEEHKRAQERAQRVRGKFATKGDVLQVKERLEHARTFKYDAALVKRMLEQKRAAGKRTGTAAQIRTALQLELNLARQEGRAEGEVRRLAAELEGLERADAERAADAERLLAAARDGDADAKARLAGGGRLPADMAFALLNARNRDRNNLRALQGGGAAAAKAAAAAAAAGADGTADVFSRRHTSSKVYWATNKSRKQAEEAAAGGAGGGEGGAGGGAAGLQRQGSAADTSALRGSLRKLDPSELVKLLQLDIDLERLPAAARGGDGAAAAAAAAGGGGGVAGRVVPKRLLGPRWWQSVERRQAPLQGHAVLTLDEWKRQMDMQQPPEQAM